MKLSPSKVGRTWRLVAAVDECGGVIFSAPSWGKNGGGGSSNGSWEGREG